MSRDTFYVYVPNKHGDGHVRWDFKRDRLRWRLVNINFPMSWFVRPGSKEEQRLAGGTIGLPESETLISELSKKGDRWKKLIAAPDRGELLIQSSRKGDIRVFDVISGSTIGVWPKPISWLASWALTNDGKELITSSAGENRLSWWSISDRKLIKQLPIGRPASPVATHLGKRLEAFSRVLTVAVKSVNGDTVTEVQPWPHPAAEVVELQFTSDGKYLIAISRSGRLALLSVQSERNDSIKLRLLASRKVFQSRRKSKYVFVKKSGDNEYLLFTVRDSYEFVRWRIRPGTDQVIQRDALFRVNSKRISRIRGFINIENQGIHLIVWAPGYPDGVLCKLDEIAAVCKSRLAGFDWEKYKNSRINDELYALRGHNEKTGKGWIQYVRVFRESELGAAREPIFKLEVEINESLVPMADEVHAISVGEGLKTEADERAWFQRGEAVCNSEGKCTCIPGPCVDPPFGHISVKLLNLKRPVSLVLGGNERMRWHLDVDDSIELVSVLAMGQSFQFVEGVPESVPIGVYAENPSPCPSCVRSSRIIRYLPYEEKKRAMVNDVIWSLTGKEVTTWQSSNEGEYFEVNSTTPKREWP